MWHAPTMNAFDAELYLRLSGERMLLDHAEQNLGPWRSELADAARALLAVGAIETPLAREVIADYGLAMALRADAGPRRTMMGRAQAQPVARSAAVLTPRRVVACDRVIEQPSGTLHITVASFGDDETTLAATFSSNSPRRRSAHRQPMRMRGGPWGGGGPPGVTLGDDRGASVLAHFSGGGSDHEWRGYLHAQPPLARDTAWIDVDGERIELVDQPQTVDAWVEQLPLQDAGSAHLWRCVASSRHFGPPADLRPAIEALVAAGALPPDDPVIGDIEAVLEALGPMQTLRTGRRPPEPWPSLFARRGREDGPTGTVVIGAITPDFGGISAAALSLESSEDGFEVRVELAPDVHMGGPFTSSIDGPPLAWWAADDCGNHYLGAIGAWSGGGDRGSGDVAFWPALDPNAKQLDIMPTTETMRAVIRVPLPWASSADHKPGATE
jgi:hypothetical protein